MTVGVHIATTRGPPLNSLSRTQGIHPKGTMCSYIQTLFTTRTCITLTLLHLLELSTRLHPTPTGHNQSSNSLHIIFNCHIVRTQRPMILTKLVILLLLTFNCHLFHPPYTPMSLDFQLLLIGPISGLTHLRGPTPCRSSGASPYWSKTESNNISGPWSPSIK